MENFQRHPSLWDLVKECVPYSELPEIRSVLGEGLIDMCTEVYSEVQMWEQIWQEKQDEQCRPQLLSSILPDPPAVKDLLRTELQLLLLTLREKAARLGRDEEEVMSQYSPRVVSYVLGKDDKNESPRNQCETPYSRPASITSHSGSRSSSRLSSRSSCGDEIEALRHKLNVTHIDEVVSHLKSLLMEECETLKKEIQYLQESVELEYQRPTELELREPTLKELKDERRIIQRDLNVQSLMNETSDKPKPSIPVPSREICLTGLPDLENLSNPTVLPTKNCLHPKPTPPDLNRPVHSGKSKHRMSLKFTEHMPLFPANSSLSNCTSTTSTTDAHPLSSSASSVAVWTPSSCCIDPREEANAAGPMRPAASNLSPALSLDHGQLCGFSAGTSVHSKQLGQEEQAAVTSALMPTPPTVQKAAGRGQRASRRLGLSLAGSLLSTS